MSVQVLAWVILAVGSIVVLGSVVIPGWLVWRSRAWAWRLLWLLMFGLGLGWASFFVTSFFCGAEEGDTCGGGGRILSVVDAPGTLLLQSRRPVLGYPPLPDLLAPRVRVAEGVDSAEHIASVVIWTTLLALVVASRDLVQHPPRRRVGYSVVVLWLIPVTLVWGKYAWLDVRRCTEALCYEGRTVSEWTRRFDSGSPPEIRQEAASALREMGPSAEPAIPALVAALKEPETGYQIGWHAARALGQMGPAARPALPALLDALEGPDSTAVAAARALIEIDPTTGDTRARAMAFWVKRLTGRVRIDERELAAENLRRFGRAAVPALTGAAAHDAEPRVRMKAAQTLGTMGSAAQAAVPTLRDLAERDPDRAIRSSAKRALEAIAEAPSPTTVSRVGIIRMGGSFQTLVDGLRQGLRELGLEEGKQFVLDVREVKGDLKAIEEAARDLERAKVDLIYTVNTYVTMATKRATSRTPIVFYVSSDPVAAGLVQSLTNPGGRLTGISDDRVADATKLTGQRLATLKEVLPGLRRVLTFYNPADPAATDAARVARESAHRLVVQLIEHQVASVEDLRRALQALKPREVDAYFFTSDAMVASQADLIIDAARAKGLPTMFGNRLVVARGALAGYGPNYQELGRQSARYVKWILVGIPPEDLRVENYDKVGLALNLRTAREIGLTIPPSVLARADEVIE